MSGLDAGLVEEFSERRRDADDDATEQQVEDTGDVGQLERTRRLLLKRHVLQLNVQARYRLSLSHFIQQTLQILFIYQHSTAENDKLIVLQTLSNAEGMKIQIIWTSAVKTNVSIGYASSDRLRLCLTL